MKNSLTIAGRAAKARDTASKSSSATTEGVMSGHLREVESLTVQFVLVYGLILLVYAASASLLFPSTQQLSTQQPGSAIIGFLLGLGSLFAVLAASVSLGGLLGFLFGIPRLLQRSPIAAEAEDANAAKAAQNSPRLSNFAGNTNLEEISDWLTKIIVGLGLTQAASIYDGFINAQTKFAQTTMDGTAGAETMFATTVISGVVAGFLFFYLETRTRVTILLVTADHVQSSFSPEQKALAQAVEADVRLPTLGEQGPEHARNGKAGTLPATEEDKKIAKIPFSDLSTVEEFSVWGTSQSKLGNFDAAEKAFSAALEKSPDDPKLYLALATVRHRGGKNQQAGETLSSAAERFSDDAAVLKATLLNALYVPAPTGYTTALAAAQKLLSVSPAAENDPQIQLWIAAANGQKYADTTDSEQKDAARAAALKAVEQVVKLAPDPALPVRKTMRNIYDPAAHGSNPEENDLEVFKGDEAFDALINAS